MRLFALALLLPAVAVAQPVDTERGATHTVTVAPGDALLIRIANRLYGPASDPAPVAIVQPDGTVLDEDPEFPDFRGVSLRLLAEHTRVVPEAAPGTWTVAFLDEETGAREALTVELIAAPVLPFSLDEAAYYGDLAALRAAIAAAEFGVDAPNGGHRTALMVAAGEGHAEAARLLLDAGADPNAMAGTDGARYEMTMTLDRPLHDAAGSGHPGIVAMLLEAGAEVDVQNAFGGTPLHSAVYGASLDSVRLLLAAGADASVEGEEGTPAALAARLAEADWTEDADRPALREIARLLGAGR